MIELILGALPWGPLIGFLINTVVVMIVVQLLKQHKEELKPYLAALAPVIAIVLPSLAATLSGLLGMPIDFSPILAFFSGFTAVGAHQIWKQREKRILMKTARIEVKG